VYFERDRLKPVTTSHALSSRKVVSTSADAGVVALQGPASSTLSAMYKSFDYFSIQGIKCHLVFKVFSLEFSFQTTQHVHE
jgi:hypothetical protein